MASTAEKLASNLDWRSLGKASDLKARLLFTLGALIIYRLGTHIPLPGIDPVMLAEIFKHHQGGILSMFDMFAGGALSRMTIFALAVMPYITASIIVQLLTAVVPSMEALKKEGEQGRMRLNQYSRYLTVFFAVMQSFALAVGLESMSGPGGSAVIDPGLFFRLTTVVTLTGGTVFLMWLGEQITSRGIGNGTSMIIYAGIAAGMPAAIGQMFEMGRTGALATWMIFAILIGLVVVLAFSVYCERAQRRIIVQYPKRQVGNKMYGGEASHLPLKINTSGVIPPIFASSLLLFPLTVASFIDVSKTPWLADVVAMLGHGQPIFMALYAFMIIFFCFFYTAVVFNPEETAENLRKNSGFVPGIRPGKNTADYFDTILTRLTVLGAGYLTVICLLPEFLMSKHAIPFYLGGTSLLIVVSVTIDTITRIQAHMMAYQYEGLFKKSMQRGKR
ncbi:MAG: preprotein translocase subunit SecY [Alphaproteobacteria bacterium]|nr:preprotein translocase subunit SecY [Alphaproteobacteria bacterium]NDC55822.1 preprotein translocase subunit SecY [Alphaproteobacteria bacterium]NDG03740.1 preprotein translocase subunit SecY [Alphaproteobacteria bacterium]